MSAFSKRQLATNKHRTAITSLGLITGKLHVAGKGLLRWVIEVRIVYYSFTVSVCLETRPRAAAEDAGLKDVTDAYQTFCEISR